MELLKKKKKKKKRGGGKTQNSGYKLFLLNLQDDIFISFVVCLFFLSLFGSSGGARIVSFGWADLRWRVTISSYDSRHVN